MKKRSFKTYFITTMLCIWIGGVAIVATEIFILNGDKNTIATFTENGFFSGKSNDIEISALKQRHRQYMDDGVVPVEKTARAPHFPKPPRMPLDKKPLIDATGDTTHVASIDELILEQKELELARIEPAAGIEGDYREGAHDTTIPDPAIPDQINPFDRKVEDIISDLQIPSQAVESSISLHENAAIDTTKEIQATPTLSPKYQEPNGTGMVVIIIDDMGQSLRSKQVEVLSGPLTLSYLPTGKNLKDRTQRAKDNGHEIMLHMPMEPMNSSLDDGSTMLRKAQNVDEFDKTLTWSFAQMDNFVGVNNHMGSRLTQDQNAMNRFMSYIQDKDVFFIDSKTVGSSVAAETAKNMGIPYAERDVFLDHEINAEFIKNALKKTENIARKKGYAIAIGHPHKETIAALKEWIPTLSGKGLILVPASRVIKHPIPENGLMAQQ
ncbi:MAG: divergent polysaccharide deacetylase family protein [Alphaproteobacteria bacterium]